MGERAAHRLLVAPRRFSYDDWPPQLYPNLAGSDQSLLPPARGAVGHVLLVPYARGRFRQLSFDFIDPITKTGAANRCEINAPLPPLINPRMNCLLRA